MDTEYAWAAGIVDGEGYIGINGGGNTRKAFTLSVKLDMIHKPTLDRLAAIFGLGNVMPLNRYTKAGRQVWRWQVFGNNALTVLKLIQPYMLTKLEEVTVAFDFMASRGPQGTNQSADKVIQHLQFADKIKKLKQYEYVKETT